MARRSQQPPDQGGPVVVVVGGLGPDLPGVLVVSSVCVGAGFGGVSAYAAQLLEQADHIAPGAGTLWGVLIGAVLGAVVGWGLLAAMWCQRWRERRWLVTHRHYVTQLQALGVPTADCRRLHRAGVTVEAFTPWTRLGIRTAFHWRLVNQAQLTLDTARNWAVAGLDARFAAAGTALGADLAAVRGLVADYLEGTGYRADLDDAWHDLAETLECHIGPGPRTAHDLDLAAMLALPPAERQRLREGGHPATGPFRRTSPPDQP